ncbi:hypothetical protein [Azohydromonas caseinilytica]|uniref:Histidine kinase n=1 Tax=Azohydromonas caseinilytica TaxID=2728836 RepID=A0A848FIG6_9BURK|nr:hypothetical protein [Azohydromonas caseinilytica]NML18675.1 hypothetical protein [Azohydromonas caseinilytica]
MPAQATPGAAPGRHHAGLGLHIAQDLVRRRGGTLTLGNRDGGGLRAQVRLPLEGPGAA